MTTKNNITGDNIVTKSSTDAYDEGWERIFGKEKCTPETKSDKIIIDNDKQTETTK